MTWYEAEAKALELGGLLFKVDSTEDEKVLAEATKCEDQRKKQRFDYLDLIRECCYLYSLGFPSAAGLWIGGNDIANEGDWVWTDGELMAKRLADRVTVTDGNIRGRCIQAKLGDLQATSCENKAVFLVAKYSGM